MVILLLESTLILFVIFEYKNAYGKVQEQYAVIGGILVFIVILCIHALLYKIKYQEKQAELSSEYEGLMEVIKEQIAMVADADTANEVKQSLESLQHIFDSKLQAGMLLNKRCKELGLKFDKVKKIYEAA